MSPDPHNQSPHKDDVSGIDTTGHEWDGIRELDNPLPKWWLYVMYACIVWAFGYWIVMPAWPGLSGYTRGYLGHSDRAEVTKSLAALQAQRGAAAKVLTNASLQQIETDPALQAYALSVGQSVFGDNCATCHGTGGTGSKGYPNLRDDVWIWGGSLDDIHTTLQYGIRSGHDQARMSAMPAFGRDGLMDAARISDLTEYVMALSGRPANAAARERAAPVFAEQCASCHGLDGKGQQLQGAPNLTDADWLYGSSREAIQAQIHNGRGGVMPAWSTRLSPETVKALAVYVHANAGG